LKFDVFCGNISFLLGRCGINSENCWCHSASHLAQLIETIVSIGLDNQGLTVIT
jgi:hypothetical protein